MGARFEAKLQTCSKFCYRLENKQQGNAKCLYPQTNLVQGGTLTLLIIHCQICDEQIATAKPTSLGVPLNGAMFGPPFPERMRHSLLTHTQWEYLRCPTCGNNPFLRDDEVMTPGGIYRIEPKDVGNSDTPEPIDTFTTKHICECCDPPREFDTKPQLSGHKGAMKREANKK